MRPENGRASLYRLSPIGLTLLLSVAGLGLNPNATAQAPAAAAAPSNDAQDPGWPRLFEANGKLVIVHAPQVDEWPKFERITFRAAISVGDKGGSNRSYGILRVSADTDIAFQDRLVVLTNRKLEGITFPGVSAADAEPLIATVMAAMPPAKPQTVSLDRLVAAMDPSKVDVRKVDVNTAPPKIFSSSQPAVMVIFMGPARFKPVPGSNLMFAINTNWDVFMDPGTQNYYLLNGKSWLTTKDVDKGPWTAAASLPPSLSSLPAGANWDDVRAAIPGVPGAQVPVVFVAHEPAELIVTQGDPEFEPIPGTGLMRGANTQSHLFFNTSDKRFFLLTAGRWFKADAVSGPWSAASDSLPADFKKLPDNAQFADVLAAVPGTPAATDAMIMASIPEKATISRSVTVNVTYDGAPKFVPIEGTAVQYASNTPFSVFMVGDKYYCCNNAVWFEATSPSGAWAVCTSVPSAIYTIPPTSPKYNVTYVTVYESTPTTVVTGYTAGYSGATVAATGVVMFGLGVAAGAALNDDCCWNNYPASYYSYGCGAMYHGAYGGYVCGSSYYGPYGGAGHAAAYNPATGVYSRGGYAYGPNGAAGYRTAYNPATGTSAGHAAGVTPYGSWGSSAVSNGDKWATASHNTTAAGTTGKIQTSSGAEAATAQGRYGNGATVAKGADGDCYASHNGNVYKNTGSGWEQAGGNSSNQPKPSSTSPSSNPNSAARSSANSEEMQQQAQARSRGEQNSQRANSYRSGGGGGGGGRRR